jgi:hypothetical protein
MSDELLFGPGDPAKVLDNLVMAAALVAKGQEDEALRQEVREVLVTMDANGFQLGEAVEKLWAGERDEAVLTAGLDERSADMVARMNRITSEATALDALEEMPDAMREALASDDSAALEAAVDAMSAEEQIALTEQLVDAGLFGTAKAATPEMNEIMEAFDPLLIAMAEIARAPTPPEIKEGVEEELAYMEQNNVHITAAVRRIWAGERDEKNLTADLDTVDAQLVNRILELLGE